jgi:nucleoid-associated protein YgaU
VLAEHMVTEGERLDQITARYLGDPEQFWRVADANNAMRPDDLTAEVGRTLRIPLPQ